MVLTIVKKRSGREKGGGEREGGVMGEGRKRRDASSTLRVDGVEVKDAHSFVMLSRQDD